jgi:hypothetical protein
MEGVNEKCIPIPIPFEFLRKLMNKGIVSMQSFVIAKDGWVHFSGPGFLLPWGSIYVECGSWKLCTK